MGINTYWFPFQTAIFSILRISHHNQCISTPTVDIIPSQGRHWPGTWATGSREESDLGTAFVVLLVYTREPGLSSKWVWWRQMAVNIEPEVRGTVSLSRKHQERGRGEILLNWVIPEMQTRTGLASDVLWDTIRRNLSCVSKIKQLSPWFCTKRSSTGYFSKCRVSFTLCSLHFRSP